MTMWKEMLSRLRRDAPSVAADTLGALSLVTILVAALYLPEILAVPA